MDLDAYDLQFFDTTVEITAYAEAGIKLKEPSMQINCTLSNQF